MFQEFKEALEKLVWTEVPATDPPTLPDGTPWDGRPLFDANQCGPDTELFKQTFPDWEQIHHDYISHMSIFLTMPMLTKMLTATNAYGQLYISDWSNIDEAEELGAFLAIVIHMGIYIYPERRKYWQRGQKGDQWVQSVMSRKRFEQILKAWHVEDYSAYTQEEIKAFKEADPFWAVASFAEELSNNFEKYWQPYQDLAVDEQTIGWKGPHEARQYNSNKPEKRHLKIESLNDSFNGYQCRFYLYRGAREERPRGIPATAYPAWRLTGNEKYHNKGYCLYTDNWFGSFMQTHLMAQRGIETISTFKGGRIGVPGQFSKRKGTKLAKRNRGEGTTLRTVLLGKEVFFTNWMDRKPVNMIHTIPSFNDSCRRWVKKKVLCKVGRSDRRGFFQPGVFKNYNKGMGAVDTIDQRLEAYRSSVKTRSWQTKMLCHFLNLIVVNLFLWTKHLYRNCKCGNCLPHYHLTFREGLCDALVKPWGISQGKKEEQERPQRLTKKHWERHYSRLTGLHIPIETRLPEDQRTVGKKRRGDSTNTRNFIWKHCILCRTNTPVSCKQCKVYLCIKESANEWNCWEHFHTCRQLQDSEYIPSESGSDDSNWDNEVDSN